MSTANRRQLDEANEDLRRATEALGAHEQSVYTKAEAFQNEQADVDRRLRELTNSRTSEEAVSVFEDNLAKLRRLDIATGYLELLQEVDCTVYVSFFISLSTVEEAYKR